MRYQQAGVDPAPLYQRSGVNIQGSGEVKKVIKKLAETTYHSQVLAGVGPFGALYSLGGQKVLVISTDGIGTKLEIARALGNFRLIGVDIVNHCINDILCSGAKPLFFVDYIAQDKLRAEQAIQLVEGMVSACLEAEIPLIGGELAQMPGIYLEGESDVVGTILGLVKKDQIIDGSKIEPGDKIIGLSSTGLHTNGFSLIREIFSEKFSWLPRHFWHLRIEELNSRLSDAVFQPHKSYLKPVSRLLNKRFEIHPHTKRTHTPSLDTKSANTRYGVGIHGMAHITGGGLPGNIVRILPNGCQAQIRLESWPVPAIFQYIQKQGNISTKEMYQVFNMGIGLVLIVPRETSGGIERILWANSQPCYLMGKIVKGKRRVEFVSQ